jgi:hypothetical protein
MSTALVHRVPIIAVLLLAGCSSGMPAQPEQSRAASSLTQSTSLLYVSDSQNGRVDIYKDYLSTSITRVGELTGLLYPYGQCVDGAGNVYITEQYGSDAVEYAHGATTPIRKVKVQGFPIGCSINPVNEDLAVAVYEESQGYNSRGGVFVFKSGSQTPTLYTDQKVFQLWPPAYDPSGNLFLLGYNPTVELVELPKGQTVFRTISLGTLQIYAPGSVWWQGSNLFAVDQQYRGGNTTAIYRLTISGSQAIVAGKTVLTDTCSSATHSSDVVQPLMVGSTIFGGNHSCASRFGFWNAATGGNPTRVLPVSIAPLDPTGQTISP